MRDYKHILNKVVPYITDNSSSLYEFVGRLYDHLKDFEGSLDEAHEKIDEFVHSFNMELDETTKTILTEWHDDGTLAELINLVWDDKAEKYYVDNLVNQTANTLTNNYTQADSNLRDQINASISTAETTLDNKITDNAQEISRIRTIADTVQIKYISDSVLEYALTITTYIQLIRCSLATDVPSTHQYADGIILRRADTNIKVILFNHNNPSDVVQNVYNGEWQGWTDIGLTTVNANIAANAQEIARVESELNNKIVGVETTLEPISATWADSVKFAPGYISVWRIGKFCLTTGFFRFTQEVPTALDWTLGVVPVGFRPAARVTTWGVAQSGQRVQLKIEPDGQITAYNYGENPIAINSGVTANLTWITND